MERRLLGKTGLKLPILSFGASSLGQEFRKVSLEEALRSVRVALESGLNFIDTSPFYGRGMSEVLLGIALRDVPRDSYLLCTKLGRYDLQHFDFSAKRVAESVDVSLHRLGTDHLDVVLCHDIEFVEMQQIVDETIPALRKVQQAGKVRFIGFSGYPQKIFRLRDAFWPIRDRIENLPPRLHRQLFLCPIRRHPPARRIHIPEHLVECRAIFHQSARLGRIRVRHFPTRVWNRERRHSKGWHIGIHCVVQP